MNAEHVRTGEQFILRHIKHARLCRPFPRQVLAPADDLHAERLADRGDARADLAHAEQAEALAAQGHARRKAFVPAAGAHVALALGEAARRRDDEAPSELGGGRRAVSRAGMADRDAALAAGLRIEAARAAASQADELQVRQALDERARKRGALSHQAKDVEGRELARGVLQRREYLMEDGFFYR